MPKNDGKNDAKNDGKNDAKNDGKNDGKNDAKNDGKNDALVDEYISTLNIAEKKALKIAHQQLETSFDIEKSIGYLEWLSKRAQA